MRYLCRTEWCFILIKITLFISSLCVTEGCESGEWRCGSGECVQIKSICNGLFECHDRSDEEHCQTLSISPTDRQDKPGCFNGQFQCASEGCYDIGFHCDGLKQCADGSDENGCPRYGQDLMPRSSLIGMGVAVGGLFLVLITIISLISCARRKNASRFMQSQQVIDQYLYNDHVPQGPIACPTISGGVVLRNPPPRYTSQPELFAQAAAINFGFNSEENRVARPPPLYSSQPNIVHDASNISLCSSVEPPPSYSSYPDWSYADINVHDTNITQGTINLSFQPDEDQILTASRRNSQVFSNVHNTTAQSAASFKSWADNLESDVFNLSSCNTEESAIGSQEQSSNSSMRSPNNTYQERDLQSQPVDDAQVYQTFRKSSSASETASYVPKFAKHDKITASKLASRVERAKALGRQYSSTPTLGSDNTSSITKRLKNKGLIKPGSIHRRNSNEAYEQRNRTAAYDYLVKRKVQSVAALDDKTKADHKQALEHKDPVQRSESTTCCHSSPGIMTPTGSKGLHFWRNHKASLSKSCVHNGCSQSSIAEVRETEQVSPSAAQHSNNPSKSLIGDNTLLENAFNEQLKAQNLHYSALMNVPSPDLQSTTSEPFTLRKNSTGSDTSINSFLC